MNWTLVCHILWHGLSPAIITAGGIIVALAHWPTGYEWLVIVASSLMALAKGVDSYFTEPSTT
jgi:hypothetical protein